MDSRSESSRLDQPGFKQSSLRIKQSGISLFSLLKSKLAALRCRLVGRDISVLLQMY
jgi:hypothetical protein